MKQSSSQPPLTQQERRAIARCCELIRERYVDTGTARGAFRVATNTDTIWIEHYFALEAMLALLAAPEEPRLVREYLSFYAQEALKQPQGVAHNFEGPLEAPRYLTRFKDAKGGWVNSDFDSIDSYAGLYLLACARYERRIGTLPTLLQTAALRSLKALEHIIHHKKEAVREVNEAWAFSQEALNNGLPIARGEYPFQQLMDAVEVYGGLYEAVALFEHCKLPDAAKTAQSLAQGVARGIRLLGPDPKHGRYAYTLDSNNAPVYDTNPYPGDLANLFALAYLPDHPSNLRTQLWESLNTTPPSSGAPLEHWLIAATRIDPRGERVKALRKKVVDQVEGFGSETYINRLALTALSLLSVNAHLPQLPTLARLQPRI